MRQTTANKMISATTGVRQSRYEVRDMSEGLASHILTGDARLEFLRCASRISSAPVVGLQPTVIASRAPHLLLEQSVKIRRIVDVHRPSTAPEMKMERAGQ